MDLSVWGPTSLGFKGSEFRVTRLNAGGMFLVACRLQDAFRAEGNFRLTASPQTLLGGSRVVISRVISRATKHITHIRGLITPLITTHEPPSKPKP